MNYDIPKTQIVIYISRTVPLINQTTSGVEKQPASKLAALCKTQWKEEESDLPLMTSPSGQGEHPVL